MIGIPWFGSAQYCLKGKVLEKGISHIIPGAKVYVPEQNLLSETDSLGNFSICGIKDRDLVIQISGEGYKTEILNFDLDSQDLNVTIELLSTARSYPEVIIIGNRASHPAETPTEVISFSSGEMRKEGAMNLSDGIAKIPGVSQLTTGVGISKPVIRGLFGNRIQTVMLGLRFDNQQWQDEHGLGLSDVGVDRVEIIKGAASVLYGSEAMGGVLNIIEEKPAEIGKTNVDVSTRFFSNTFGTANDIGVKGANSTFNWRIRAGYESHADYTDGNGKRILNSRFGGEYLKTSLGFKKKNWVSQNHYMFSGNNFGFLMDPEDVFQTPDNRQSRSFERPHHTVFLNVFSSDNVFYLKSSKLKATIGAQVNDRQEQEGGSKISLDMILQSYSTNILWEKKITKTIEFSLGNQEMMQFNRNIGSRTIVPDANLTESSLFSYLKYKKKVFFLEGGLRYSLKNIHTFETGSINTQGENPGTSVVPFNKLYQALTGSLGISLFDNKHWNLKSNISTGFRPGNLAELSSNGLHEGSVRYEIGNINLKTEQNFCGDVFLSYDSKQFTVSCSAYLNHFLNYIYLAPTNEEYIGFQIFRYVQKDANLVGNESTIELHPSTLKWLSLTSGYSIVVGKTSDNEYLPFIPAQNLKSELKFTPILKGVFSSTYLKAGVDHYFAQNTPGQFETRTGSYTLFNAGLGTELQLKKNLISISVSGNNLLNTVYYSHLSRFKYFNIYNIGRNISVNFKISF